MVDRYPARVPGPLASYVAGFRAEPLVVLGYTPRVAQDSAYVLAHLSRWLESEGIAAAERPRSRSCGSPGPAARVVTGGG
jgi:hypothetical protein